MRLKTNTVTKRPVTLLPACAKCEWKRNDPKPQRLSASKPTQPENCLLLGNTHTHTYSHSKSLRHFLHCVLQYLFAGITLSRSCGRTNFALMQSFQHCVCVCLCVCIGPPSSVCVCTQARHKESGRWCCGWKSCPIPPYKHLRHRAGSQGKEVPRLLTLKEKKEESPSLGNTSLCSRSFSVFHTIIASS